MPCFVPDNDNRKTRVVQLGAEAQEFLFEAQKDYAAFQDLLTVVNGQITNTYKEAGFKPPGTTSIDIVKATHVDDGSIVVDVAKILADISGFVGTLKYLIPGAIRAMVSTGVLAETTAGRILANFTIPLIDREVTITLGDVAGSIIGGLASGIAIVGSDLAIDGIEGAIDRHKLRTAINQAFPLRAGTRLSQKKAATLLESLRAVKTTLDALSGSGVPPTESIIQKSITKDVAQAIVKCQSITATTVAAELRQLDVSNDSWTHEDPSK